MTEETNKTAEIQENEALSKLRSEDEFKDIKRIEKKKMSTKSKVIVFAVLFLMAAGIAFISIYFSNPDVAARGYYQKNWALSLPKSCLLEYTYDSGKELKADRLYYRIFNVTNDDELLKLDGVTWQLGKENIGVKEINQNVISAIEIEDEYLPKFSGVYYAAAFTRRDQSQLYLIYNQTDRKLYSGERIKALYFNKDSEGDK